MVNDALNCKTRSSWVRSSNVLLYNSLGVKRREKKTKEGKLEREKDNSMNGVIFFLLVRKALNEALTGSEDRRIRLTSMEHREADRTCRKNLLKVLFARLALQRDKR